MLRKYPHTFLVEEYAPENRQAFDRHVHTPALYINPNSGRSLKSRLVYLKYSKATHFNSRPTKFLKFNLHWEERPIEVEVEGGQRALPNYMANAI